MEEVGVKKSLRSRIKWAGLVEIIEGNGKRRRRMHLEWKKVGEEYY